MPKPVLQQLNCLKNSLIRYLLTAVLVLALPVFGASATYSRVAEPEVDNGAISCVLMEQCRMRRQLAKLPVIKEHRSSLGGMLLVKRDERFHPGTVLGLSSYAPGSRRVRAPPVIA